MRSANAAHEWPSKAARDYYEVLGVARTADGDAIRQAYRRLARELHPDVSAEPKAEERFRELTGAYTVLSDPNARLLYDRFGYRGRGSGFSPARRESSASPVLAEVNVDVFEAARGARREVRYSSREQCQACNGQGFAAGGCETCGGKGRLTRSATLRGGDWLQVEECPDCNGRGFSEQDACPECHGEGSLAQEQVMKVPHPRGRGGRQPAPHGRRPRRRAAARPGPAVAEGLVSRPRARGGAPLVRNRPARLLSEPQLAHSHSRFRSTRRLSSPR